MQDKPTEISAMGSCCMLTVIDHTGYGVIRIAGQPAFFNRQRDYTVFIVAQSRMGQAIIRAPLPIGRSWQEGFDLHSPLHDKPQPRGDHRTDPRLLQCWKTSTQALNHLMARPRMLHHAARRGRVVAARGARSKSLALRYATANRIRLREQCASAVWRRNIPFGAGFEKTVDNANRQFSACRNCGYAEISKQPRAEESRI